MNCILCGKEVTLLTSYYEINVKRVRTFIPSEIEGIGMAHADCVMGDITVFKILDYEILAGEEEEKTK